ncbi:MAG: hypothetical protein ACRDV9_06775 [Acidimicrobiia bacterium]
MNNPTPKNSRSSKDPRESDPQRDRRVITPRDRQMQRLILAMIIIVVSGRIVVPLFSSLEVLYDILNRIFILFSAMTLIAGCHFQITSLKRGQSMSKVAAYGFLFLFPLIFLFYYWNNILDAFWLR